MKNLMINHTGALVSTLTWQAVRPIYEGHYSRIKNSQQLRATIRAGASTELGGYPCYLLCADGEALCFTCTRANYRALRSGWPSVIACEINYEDEHLTCAHCYGVIPSAYGEGGAE